MTSPADEPELYDIHNRPKDWELKMDMAVGLLFCVGLGGVAPLFLLHWLGVRQWPLILIPLLGAFLLVWAQLRSLKRRGVEARKLYAAHGGNTAGISDWMFGHMTYSITPDGRWKWPKPTYSSD